MPVVKLYANLRKLAGTNEMQVAGGTVSQVIEEIVDRIPSLETKIWEDDRLQPHLVITVNGIHIETMNGLQTSVDDEDQIAIFPPIAGGSF